MKVKRIITNISSSEITKAKLFYREVLGMKVLMDQGWIATYGSGSRFYVRDPFGKLINILAHI